MPEHMLPGAQADVLLPCFSGLRRLQLKVDSQTQVGSLLPGIEGVRLSPTCDSLPSADKSPALCNDMLRQPRRGDGGMPTYSILILQVCEALCTCKPSALTRIVLEAAHRTTCSRYAQCRVRLLFL